MFTPLILFFGLTVATAVIAHWSDNLGKKLGKKRVSLFGLRPRTTATILTVASSWGIMLFTLAALLITAPQLRKALFSYDRERAQAQIDRERAKTEIETAQKRLQATQFQYNAANSQVGRARTELKAAQTDLKKAGLEVKSSQIVAKAAEAEGKKRAFAARKQADEAVARANEAQQRFVEAQNRVALAQKSLELAQKRESVARRGEALAQSETEKARNQTQVAQREREGARRQTAKARRLTQQAQSDLRRARANLQFAQTELRRTNSSLKSASTSLLNASRAAFGATKTLFETEKQVKVLEAQRADLENLASATLRNDAPIKVDQVFAARIIDARQKPETIAAQLREMLQQGQESFRQTEDELPEPRFPPEARVQLLPLPVPDASGNPLILEGDAVLRYQTNQIISEGEPVSARLVAPRNFLASETLIELRFVFVPIKPAFQAGTVLASTTIDGAQNNALIFNSLLELTKLGRSEAEKRGVNPPQSADEQNNFYANGTNVRIFDAIDRIKARRAPVVVNLVADKSLTTVEPLQVRFEIEGALGAATS